MQTKESPEPALVCGLSGPRTSTTLRNRICYTTGIVQSCGTSCIGITILNRLLYGLDANAPGAFMIKNRSDLGVLISLIPDMAVGKWLLIRPPTTVDCVQSWWSGEPYIAFIYHFRHGPLLKGLLEIRLHRNRNLTFLSIQGCARSQGSYVRLATLKSHHHQLRRRYGVCPTEDVLIEDFDQLAEWADA